MAPSGSGWVVEILSPDRAERILQITQERLGMPINPRYLSNPRAVVRSTFGSSTREVVALVPAGMNIGRGAHVRYTGGHIEASAPCRYVPNLISATE